jgi:hypothetical protein|tara:strand:- start:1130 stop:1714 length:585 start_codon:yes stop_codon:yes gene_type:complete
MLMGKDGADGEGDFQNGLLSSSGNGNGDGHGGDGLERLGDDDGDLEFLEYDWRSGNGDGTKQSSQTNVDETSRQKQKKTNWDKWEPEPVASEAASSRGRKRAGDDELTQLVSIYGSKEVFIGEYRYVLYIPNPNTVCPYNTDTFLSQSQEHVSGASFVKSRVRRGPGNARLGAFKTKVWRAQPTQVRSHVKRHA